MLGNHRLNMKFFTRFLAGNGRTKLNLCEKFKFCFLSHFFAALAAILIATAVAAQAGNLLINAGFEANSGHVVAAGWNYFSPPLPPGYFGDYWVDNAVPANSGTNYWKEWGALYLPAQTNNVAGIYQAFSSAPGAIYQAGGWFCTSAGDALGTHCMIWLQVEFLDATMNVLALYKSSDFSASSGMNMWYQFSVTNACDLSLPH